MSLIFYLKIKKKIKTKPSQDRAEGNFKKCCPNFAAEKVILAARNSHILQTSLHHVNKSTVILVCTCAEELTHPRNVIFCRSTCYNSRCVSSPASQENRVGEGCFQHRHPHNLIPDGLLIGKFVSRHKQPALTEWLAQIHYLCREQTRTHLCAI